MFIPEYRLEARLKNVKTGNYDSICPIEGRIQPTFTQELGMADQLTFNLLLSDPKCRVFPPWGNFIGLEIWLYGPDNALKNVFVPVTIEMNRDYGATSMGSGSGGLGGGSGDSMLVTCEGPESYLNNYYVQNYKVSQRLPHDIINDITAEAQADKVITSIYVDPSLNVVALDIDLSWENLQTATGNIVAQTGGFMRVEVDVAVPAHRALCIRPIPGQVAQPTDVGITSAVLPQ